MAERDEAGPGRLAEVAEIMAAAIEILAERSRAPAARLVERPLAGRHVLVTSGPTHEPIDPVRYIANRSSGKQGHAIARAAAALGARVTLVTGPVSLPDPAGRRGRARRDGRGDAARGAGGLPADIAVFAAAVADWRSASAPREKIKKSGDKPPASTSSRTRTSWRASARRAPAARAGHRLCRRDRQRRRAKRRRSASRRAPTGSSPTMCRRRRGVFGGDGNTVHLVTADGVEDWPTMSKDEVARRLMQRAAEHLRRGAAAAE